MSGDVHVRFCESVGLRFPGATHRNIYVRSERAGQRGMKRLTRFITKDLKRKVNATKSAVARPIQGVSTVAGRLPANTISLSHVLSGR
jgi:hypothetical protein